MAQLKYKGKTYMPNSVLEVPELSDDKMKAFIGLSRVSILGIDKIVDAAKNLLLVAPTHPLGPAYADLMENKGILYESLKNHCRRLEQTEMLSAAFGRLPSSSLEALCARSSNFEEFYFALPRFNAYDFEVSLALEEAKLPDKGIISGLLAQGVTVSDPLRVFPVMFRYRGSPEPNVVVDVLYSLFSDPSVRSLLSDRAVYNLKPPLQQRIIPDALAEASHKLSQAEPEVRFGLSDPKIRH